MPSASAILIQLFRNDGGTGHGAARCSPSLTTERRILSKILSLRKKSGANWDKRRQAFFMRDEYTHAGEIAVVEREIVYVANLVTATERPSDQRYARTPCTCSDCGARLCRERSGCNFGLFPPETCQVVVSSFESRRYANFRFGRYTPSHMYNTIKFSSFEYRTWSVIRSTCLLCRERPVLFSRICTVLSPT